MPDNNVFDPSSLGGTVSTPAGTQPDFDPSLMGGKPSVSQSMQGILQGILPNIGPAPASTQPQQGFLHNLGAGTVNPWIALTNLLAKHLPSGATLPTSPFPSPPSATMAQMKTMGQPQAPFSPQPQISANEGSGAYLLGNILGIAPIFGVGSEALGAAGELSGLSGVLKGAPQAVQRAAQIGKSGLAGGGTGYATTPGTSGQRGVGAAEQALGGGEGETLGQGVGAVKRSLQGIGTPAKIITAMQEKLTPKDQAAESLINDIGKSYANAKNAVKPAYDDVFAGKQKMVESDLPNYTKVINEDLRTNRAIPRAVEMPDTLMRDHENTGNSYISPQEVHYLKSSLSGLAKGGNDKEMKIAYGKYSKALNSDLQDYLGKNGKLEAYKKANKTFIEKLLPFRKSKAFSKKIEDSLDYATTPDALGNHKLSLENVDPTLQSTKAIKSFLPDKSEEDLGKINELENILGGNRTLTNHHIKSNTLAQHREGEGVNLKTLTNRYNRYSPQQKNRLFSKEEQDRMKALTKAVKIQGGGVRQLGRLLRGTALGATVGHAISPKSGLEIGALLGAPLTESGLKSAGKVATAGKQLPALIKSLLSPAPIKQAGKRMPAIIGSQLLNNILNPRGTP